MLKKQQGFTLIELMIVVAIIAILAAIAIPQYQDYVTKSQFSESQTVADALEKPVQQYYLETGTCVTNGQGGTMSSPSYSGKYVAAAGDLNTLSSGCQIVVVFKSTPGSVSTPLLGANVYFSGVSHGGTFTWQCSAPSVASKYKPQACQ